MLFSNAVSGFADIAEIVDAVQKTIASTGAMLVLREC
jgi:hypothetical protein